MKKLLAIFSSILLVGVAAEAYAADAALPTIAVVNVQQLFQQSPKISDLNKQLQNKFKPRQEKLLSAQKALQAEVDKYKKESPTMSQSDKDAMQKKISGDQSNLAKDAAAFQQDLNKEQGKVMKSVLAQLNDVISTVAKKHNYALVLDSQAVIYAADSADITKEVSKEFDSKQ